MKEDPHDVQFDAFASYSCDPDYRLVRRVEVFLESLHKRVSRENGTNRALRICVDGSDFNLAEAQRRTNRRAGTSRDGKTGAAWNVIEAHLRRSRYLMVFCCPQARNHYWMNREAEWFLTNGREDRAILCVSSCPGERVEIDQLVPQVISKANVMKEPIWFDFRGHCWRMRTGRRKVRDFDEERLRVAAQLLDMTLSQLEGPYERSKRLDARRRGMVALVLVFVFAFIAGLALYEWRQAVDSRMEALRGLSRSQSKTAAIEALRRVQHDPAGSVAFAIHSLRLWPSQEARAIAANALVNLPAYNIIQVHPAPKKNGSIFPPLPRVRAMHFVGDRGILLLRRESGIVELYDSSTGEKAFALGTARRASRLSLDKGNWRISLIRNGGSVAVFDLESRGSPIKILELHGDYATARLSGDGRRLVTCDRSGILAVRNVRANGPAREWTAGQLAGIAVNEDGSRLATVDRDGKVRVYDASQDAPCVEFKTRVIQFLPSVPLEVLTWRNALESGITDANHDIVPRLEVTGRLTALVTACAEGTPSIKERISKAHEVMVSSARPKGDVLSVDLHDLAPGYAIHDDVLRDIISGRFEIADKHCEDVGPFVEFAADQDALLVYSQYDAGLYLEIWDLNQAEKPRSAVIKGVFSRFASSPDMREIAVIGTRSVMAYSIRRGDAGALVVELVARWAVSPEHLRAGGPRAVAYGPYGRIICTSHSPFAMKMKALPATVSLWLSRPIDSRDGDDHLHAKLRPHESVVTLIAFSPDGRMVSTYSVDGRVSTWRISSGDSLYHGGKPSETLGEFVMNDTRYIPTESHQIMGKLFATDDEMIKAIRRITTRALTSAELEQYGLPPLTTGPGRHHRHSRGEREPVNRPTCPLRKLIDRPSQVAVSLFEEDDREPTQSAPD